jgi:hypothetical protein
VRNGAFYVENFIRHYTRLGFKHIFFLDNGSSDDTITLIKKYDNVSICSSALPVAANQGIFKKHLAKTSVRGGWCLDADIDEFLEYPFSDILRLDDFLDYMNRHHYTAVITQMLDMFSDQPLSAIRRTHDYDLQQTYSYFDTSAITKTTYAQSNIATQYGSANRLANDDTVLYWGGIRKTLYGNDCLLTKHSLFYTGARLELFRHVHFVNHARLADISCVLLHYKLTANALDIAQQNKERFTANAKSYCAFINLLMKTPDFQIRRETAVRFGAANDLVGLGFLMISNEYREYVRTFHHQSHRETRYREASLQGQ